MSTGNPNPIPLIHPTELERLKEIPLSWFHGVGYKDRGILAIGYSQEFNKMGGGEITKYTRNYGHFMGTKKDPSEIENEEERVTVIEAERKIKEMTGFSVQELNGKFHELNELYRYKKEAPFEFELVDSNLYMSL